MMRITLPVYCYKFFDDLVFIYPLYAVMFSERGLSALEISILFSVWSTVTFLLEIPSGAIADKYSRKHILFFGQIVRLMGYACWMFFQSFWGFLAGFVCWGIESAFASGTFQALVFDELKHAGEEDSYAKIMGRAGSLSTAGGVIATLSAAIMIKFGYAFVVAASLVSLAVSSLAIVSLSSAPRAERVSEESYLCVLKAGVSEAFRNRVVLRLMMFFCFAMVFLPQLEEYWSLFYRCAGIPVAGIPILCVVMSLPGVVAGAVAHRFERVSDRVIIAGFAACGVVLFVAARFMQLASVLGVPLICSLWVIIGVVLEARLQHSIEGEARATVLSVGGCAEEIVAVFIYMGLGATANKWGYPSGFAACGAAMTLIGVLWLVLGGRSPFRTSAGLKAPGRSAGPKVTCESGHSDGRDHSAITQQAQSAPAPDDGT